MKHQSLAASNPYLKRADADERLALNLATSTAVETGKPASEYVERYRFRHDGEVRDESSPAHHKKSPA